MPVNMIIARGLIAGTSCESPCFADTELTHASHRLPVIYVTVVCIYKTYMSIFSFSFVQYSFRKSSAALF